MKALWFLPFTFAAGAEGFALFAPYLILVLSTLYFARMARRARRTISALRLPTPSHVLDAIPAAHPAL